MSNWMSLLSWIAAFLVLIPMWVVTIEAIGALAYRVHRKQPEDRGEVPGTVVLMPAHNEQSVIRRTLESLTADLPPKCRILCIAHNCSDATAEIAREFGADVLEVADQGTGGKPDALKAGLRSLDQDPPEIVVIIDADCVVTPGSVAALASRAKQLGHPVMGAYFFAQADAGIGKATVSSLAVMLKNYIRPLGLRQLGMPCLLNGSGSAYPFQMIRNVPHGEGSIAEDYQLTIDLLRKGHPTTFLPEAKVEGQLPNRDSTAQRQRRRWEHGHLFLAFRVAPRLLLEGLAKLDRDRLGLALELAVPPLAFLVLMWGGATVLALPPFLLNGGGPFGFLLFTVVVFASAVLAGWVRFAGAGKTFSALASIPGYLVWKLPMYRDFFTRRETRWVKTNRD